MKRASEARKVRVCLAYSHRDASGVRRSSGVVFMGELSWQLSKRIEKAMATGERFIADQVRVPELFPWNSPLTPNGDEFLLGEPEQQPVEGDTCWHDYIGVATTSADPNDVHGRTIDEFVAELERVAAGGWRPFNLLAKSVR
jgi:hypothetical protein